LAPGVCTGDVPQSYGTANGEVLQTYDLQNRQFAVVPDSANLWTPRWSPDGRYIAAVTIFDRNLKLFDVRLQTWTSIDVNHVDNPTWSRDSRFIYYNTEGGIRSLRRVHIPDGAMQEVVSLEGFRLLAYWWSGLSLDDAPLVLRSLGGPEIYSLTLVNR
jgi:hypothetical protein